MAAPRPFQRIAGIRRPLICLVALIAAACSEAAGSGDPRLVIEITQDAITVENRTGTPLTRGEVSVIPQGTVPRAYTMVIPRLSIGEKRSFLLTSFRNPDGTRFMRGVAKGRAVRVTARDVGGQIYEREVPFK